MNKTIYRMSSAGHCPRRIGYKRLNYEPLPVPSWLAQSAEEGNWHESRIIAELAQKENKLVTNRQEEFVLDFPTFQVIGHIDGVITENGRATQLLEVKSMSQQEYSRWTRGRFIEFPWYEAQMTLYLHATELTLCRYIVKDRNLGNKDDRTEIYNPLAYTPIITKLASVEELAMDASILAIKHYDNLIKEEYYEARTNSCCDS
jgi:hypothetical protein